MLPINNSDTAWLIVTDYNQDNNLPYEELRNDIISPNTNQWYFEYIAYYSLGGNIIETVGSANSVRNTVGYHHEESTIGVGDPMYRGILVGGNHAPH